MVAQIVIITGHESHEIEMLVKTYSQSRKQHQKVPIVCVNVAAISNKHGAPYENIQVSVRAAFQHGQSLMGQRKEIDGVLLSLVDLPLLQAEDVQSLLSAAQTSFCDALIPKSAEQTGHPIWLSRNFFLSIDTTSDDFSLRKLLHTTNPADRYKVQYFITRRNGYFVDLDTPDDIEALSINHGVEITYNR